ncbi:hypothetical protein HK100_012690 [Physocladia obscura]|uniref:Uncharacterized protein n=1 Tax=Physocladia obscura TaxID=109957 RepID=A0AAD5T0E9_9FUNG|nr:hypothetical protein HK100_012690 [Physocladia obscura]
MFSIASNKYTEGKEDSESSDEEEEQQAPPTETTTGDEAHRSGSDISSVVDKKSLASGVSLDSHASRGSALSKARSGRSNASSFDDTTLGKFIKKVESLKVAILESEQYKSYRLIVDSSRNQILAVGFLQATIFGSIFFVLQFVLKISLPSIRFYNLTHAVMAFQGKLLLAFGWDLSYLVRKGFAAVQILSQKKGVSLTEISNVDPDACRNIIRIFRGSLFLIELGLWTVTFFMDWEPLNTYLGDYSCTLLTFNHEWTMGTYDEIQAFIGGNSDLGIISSFGLPLASGFLAAQTSIPNYVPSTVFQTKGLGVVALIETICDAATPLKSQSKYTQIKLLTSQYWGQSYSAGIELIFPYQTHSWTEYIDVDIAQKCQVVVLTGMAYVGFEFTSDEWGDLTPNSVIEVDIGSSLTIVKGASSSVDFAQVQAALSDTETTFLNITSWIAEAMSIMFNSTDVATTNNQVMPASMLTWGANSAGAYDPSLTWQGVASATGMISHYVFDHSDNSQNSICSYTGTAGYGVIGVPSWITTLLTVLLIIGILMQVIVIASWFLAVGGGEYIDKAVQMIDNPHRTMYYMRDSAARLMQKINGPDIGHISLMQHLTKVMVRFGEDKTTRGNNFGTLVLDEPKKVVNIAKNRILS